MSGTVLILGGGIAGLTAALHLGTSGHSVTVIDQGDAIGGRLCQAPPMRRTMGRYFEEIRLIVERHGGTVEKFIGDAVMAVFGIPVAHEDDALRAVRAVAEIRDRLAALGEELRSLSFRTGVNTGQVVAGEGETLITGDAVNVAARLEQAAAPGSILIGADTLAWSGTQLRSSRSSRWS